MPCLACWYLSVAAARHTRVNDVIDFSGVGVYELSASETYNSVKWALQVRTPLKQDQAAFADQRAAQAGYRLVC